MGHQWWQHLRYRRWNYTTVLKLTGSKLTHFWSEVKLRSAGGLKQSFLRSQHNFATTHVPFYSNIIDKINILLNRQNHKRMRFGICSYKRPVMAQAAVIDTPKGASRKLSKPTVSSSSRPQTKERKMCQSFYWDISSVFLKTACLATFLVVEGPRRLVAYSMRRPEPKPFFVCSQWGYRMCVCGRHYYDHVDGVQTTKSSDDQRKRWCVCAATAGKTNEETMNIPNLVNSHSALPCSRRINWVEKVGVIYAFTCVRVDHLFRRKPSIYHTPWSAQNLIRFLSTV